MYSHVIYSHDYFHIRRSQTPMTIPKGHQSAFSGSILCSLSPQELLPQAWGGLGKERIVILLLLGTPR